MTEARSMTVTQPQLNGAGEVGAEGRRVKCSLSFCPHLVDEIEVDYVSLKMGFLPLHHKRRSQPIKWHLN